MFPRISFSSIIVLGLALLAIFPIASDFQPGSQSTGGAEFALAAETAPPAKIEDFRRIAQELEALTPELMRKHGVVGAQIHLFGDPRGGRDRSVVFGHADADRTRAVQSETLFQAADLVRPLTAYLLLTQVQSEARSAGLDFEAAARAPLKALADFPVQNADEFADSARPAGQGLAPFSAYELLTMSSGLPPSRDGLIRGELERPDPDGYLRERLTLTHAPGDLFAVAPEGYAYAGKYLEARAGVAFDTQLRSVLSARFGVRAACVDRDQCPAAVQSLIADGTVHSGSYVFALDPPHVLYPAADSLWISAADYGRFLRRALQLANSDPVAAALFEPVRRSDAGLGGRAMGFQALRSSENISAETSAVAAQPSTAIYTGEGRQPGYSSYAFVTPEGRGAVLFCNSNERFFIREMVSYLYDRFALLETSPPAPSAAALEQAQELEGSYRARATVPARESLFSFLTDVRIRSGARQIDFGGVFQKEAGVQLYPIAPDLYLARGPVAMDGWRVKVRRDADGDVVGLDSDLVRYDRVHPLISAWAILMYLGMLTSLPVLFFMLFIIRRKSAALTQDSDANQQASSGSEPA
ncbi:MAG: beta-lactamase family protein [bacterium]|nr:beta-lactamase family protein [bacterium]